jgi:16S rRNA processing protein RimM
VRGWLRVRSDDPQALAAAPEWWIGGEARRVEETKLHSGTLLAKLAGIESPERARGLRGGAVAIPRPDPGEGRYYWAELVGLEVVNGRGVALGAVRRMSFNGAHDVMELEGGRLLPWVPAVVKRVDLAARRIEVEWGEDW